MVVRLPAIVGIVVTGMCSLWTIHLPMRLGLPVSVLIGVTAALAVETLSARDPKDTRG